MRASNGSVSAAAFALKGFGGDGVQPRSPRMSSALSTTFAPSFSRPCDPRLRPESTLTLQAELGDADCLPDLVDAVLGRFGHLDALVNNASAFYPTPLATVTPSQWDELFAANARAPLFLAQAAAPHLAGRNGAIVNLVDIYAERPLRGHALYAMTKAALLQMTRALALELAPQVRVNAVSPGAILWPEPSAENPGKDAAAKHALLAHTPLARIGTVEEIADAVAWLLCNATYTTGQVIRVDGGRTLAD